MKPSSSPKVTQQVSRTRMQIQAQTPLLPVDATWKGSAYTLLRAVPEDGLGNFFCCFSGKPLQQTKAGPYSSALGRACWLKEPKITRLRDLPPRADSMAVFLWHSSSPLVEGQSKMDPQRAFLFWHSASFWRPASSSEGCWRESWFCSEVWSSCGPELTHGSHVSDTLRPEANITAAFSV